MIQGNEKTPRDNVGRNKGSMRNTPVNVSSDETISQDRISEKDVLLKKICDLDAENTKLEHEIYTLRVLIEIYKSSTWY